MKSWRSTGWREREKEIELLLQNAGDLNKLHRSSFLCGVFFFILIRLEQKLLYCMDLGYNILKVF